MSTPFTEIFDQFMSLQTDYRLISLYRSSVENFETYLQGWLMPSIVEFQEVPCNQDLSFNLTTKTFTQTLTLQNQIILAHLMKKYWLRKEVNDISQMKNFIQDKDFSSHSASQNLKEKRDLMIVNDEEISQKLVEYGYKNIDWNEWLQGNFGGT
jgi:hypothetical protein